MPGLRDRLTGTSTKKRLTLSQKISSIMIILAWVVVLESYNPIHFTTRRRSNQAQPNKAMLCSRCYGFLDEHQKPLQDF